MQHQSAKLEIVGKSCFFRPMHVWIQFEESDRQSTNPTLPDILGVNVCQQTLLKNTDRSWKIIVFDSSLAVYMLQTLGHQETKRAEKQGAV